MKTKLISILLIGFLIIVFSPTSNAVEVMHNYTASVSGQVTRTNQATWALAHDPTTGTGTSSNTITKVQLDAGGYSIGRTFISFDTSALPDDVIILDSRFCYDIDYKSYDHTDSAVLYDADSSWSGSSLTTSDYAKYTDSDNIEISGVEGGSYCDGSVSVNPAGYTKFAILMDTDINNVDPFGGINGEDEIDLSGIYLEVTYELNPCDYIGSGNWSVDWSDNCVINSPVNLLGNTLFVTGNVAGSFTINNTNITNAGGLVVTGGSGVSHDFNCFGGCIQ